MSPRISFLAGALLVACGLCLGEPPADSPAPLPARLSGIVRGVQGPLAGALVQVQGTPNRTTADAQGAFTLGGIEGPAPLVITAWAEGHYVGWVSLEPGGNEWTSLWGSGRAITITLKPLPAGDNHEYGWFSFEGLRGSPSCALCHRESAEWRTGGHAQSARNQRFVTLYNGTDVNGRRSQVTRWGPGGKPLSPDPSQPDYGPGFRLDAPDRTGNCAACHTPVASTVPNRTNCGWSGCHSEATVERLEGSLDRNTLPVGLSGEAAEGITCEFCHKVGAVKLDPATRLPAPDLPGILSMRLHRPEPGQEIFFGTVLDVTRRVSYLPLQARSEFCAPCHYGVFDMVLGPGVGTGGTLIYNSYGEWLASPYSQPQTGKTCQDCHMPVSSTRFFVFPERGGRSRDYAPLHEHHMRGAGDERLLQNAVSLRSSARRADGNQLHVEVSVTNDRTGHHVPTDAPIRSMILVVAATGRDGQPLGLRQGPLNPAYSGNFGGLPGKTFARVLKDKWTGEAPTAAYWRPVSLVEDTRLAALATDTTRYSFELPAGQAATVAVRLYFRRTFQRVMELKGYKDPDVLMAEQTIRVLE